MEVLAGGKHHSERALFLCWPNNGTTGDWDAKCLELYSGDVCCYIGEFDDEHVAGPRTSSKAFQASLRRDFVLVERVAIPSWLLSNDDLSIWRRRSGHPTAQ